MDIGAPRPYPADLREHSPDYGTYHGSRTVERSGRPIPLAPTPRIEGRTRTPRATERPPNVREYADRPFSKGLYHFPRSKSPYRPVVGLGYPFWARSIAWTSRRPPEPQTRVRIPAGPSNIPGLRLGGPKGSRCTRVRRGSGRAGEPRPPGRRLEGRGAQLAHQKNRPFGQIGSAHRLRTAVRLPFVWGRPREFRTSSACRSTQRTGHPDARSGTLPGKRSRGREAMEARPTWPRT